MTVLWILICIYFAQKDKCGNRNVKNVTTHLSCKCTPCRCVAFFRFVHWSISKQRKVRERRSVCGLWKIVVAVCWQPDRRWRNGLNFLCDTPVSGFGHTSFCARAVKLSYSYAVILNFIYQELHPISEIWFCRVYCLIYSLVSAVNKLHWIEHALRVTPCFRNLVL
jgi:hypothetical protein